MRLAALTAGVLLLLTASATPVPAQVRGRLTSRPAPQPVAPRAGTARPVRLVPVWWNWGIVMLPETTTLTSPPLADGAPTGGVQLDVLPWSAEVFVDGARAGRVEEFRGYYQHLEIAAGPHAIAIVAPGRDVQVFDVVVVPGKTITYRGTLR
jgi:hypothetical protein